MGYNRDSYVRYRSFYEACLELSDADYRALNTALDRFALDGIEPTDLTGVAKALYVAFRPQIAANFQRFIDGCKGGCPKGKVNNPSGRNQYTKDKPVDNSEDNRLTSGYPSGKPNDNENVNVNDNENVNVKDKDKSKKKETEAIASCVSEVELKFERWLKDKFPSVATMTQPLTYQQYMKLKDRYGPDRVMAMLRQMENWKPLKQKNKNAYQTFINWITRDDQRNTTTRRQEYENNQFEQSGGFPQETGGGPTFTSVPD